MGLEPKTPVNDLENIQEHQDRIDVDAFVEKMQRIDEILHEQMLVAQAAQERFANAHRQHAPKYQVGDLV